MIRRSEISNANHLNIVTVTGNYTVKGNEDVILADATTAAFTITLLDAVANKSLSLLIKKSDSTANAVTIATSLSQLIDGASTVTLGSQYATIALTADGTGWSDRGVAFATLVPNSVITVAAGGNTPGLTINQNDTTNNPDTLVLTNTGTGKALLTKGKSKSIANNLGNITVFTTDAQSTDIGGSIVMGGMQDTAATTLVGFASISGRKENAVDGNTRGNMVLAVGGVERIRIDSRANIVPNPNAGAALATTATDGFIYTPNCAGTPTGNPTTNYTYTGRTPMVYDTTGHKIWFYDAGWKGVVVA